VRVEPDERVRADDVCPVCGKCLTVGVLHRLLELADRTAQQATRAVERECRHLVPLCTIVSQALGVGPTSLRVTSAVDDVLDRFGPELDVLMNVPIDALAADLPERIARGIEAVREGALDFEPGYDGVYGRVRVRFDEGRPRRVG